MKLGLHWPALALFGLVWHFNTLAHPANVLAQILSLSSSTGILPNPKFLGRCEGYHIQKWLSATPMWTATVGAHLSHGEGVPVTHTQTHTETHSYTLCHAEVGEMADYPLCECVFNEAMQGQSMQLRLLLCLNWQKVAQLLSSDVHTYTVNTAETKLICICNQYFSHKHKEWTLIMHTEADFIHRCMHTYNCILLFLRLCESERFAAAQSFGSNCVICFRLDRISLSLLGFVILISLT